MVVGKRGLRHRRLLDGKDLRLTWVLDHGMEAKVSHVVGKVNAVLMHYTTCGNPKGVVTCGIINCGCRHPDFAATPSGLVAVSLVYELRTQAQLDKAGIVILHP